MLSVSGSMFNWGCGVRGSDRGHLQLMTIPTKTLPKKLYS